MLLDNFHHWPAPDDGVCIIWAYCCKYGEWDDNDTYSGTARHEALSVTQSQCPYKARSQGKMEAWRDEKSSNKECRSSRRFNNMISLDQDMKCFPPGRNAVSLMTMASPLIETLAPATFLVRWFSTIPGLICILLVCAGKSAAVSQ